MELHNFEAQKVILHEVFAVGVDKRMPDPDCSEALEVLDEEALDALCDRVITAMNHKSKAMPMAIAINGPGSMVEMVAKLAAEDDDSFVSISGQVARKLASCQTSRKIPGGVVVVISGTYGAPSREVVCVIKAEVHNGFVRAQSAEGRKLQFLKNLMLTAQTKLYKVGLFASTGNAGEWSAYIYDELLTASNKEDAAAYFYRAFLGLELPQTSARQTSKFHELTKSFITGMNVDEEEKISLHNALVTYLKVDQSPTVGVEAFADTYLAEAEVKQLYADFMVKAGFELTPINKDISDIRNKLKSRRISFRSGIRVSGPAEEFRDKVTVDTIDSLVDGDGGKWTRIIVKDRISQQE